MLSMRIRHTVRLLAGLAAIGSPPLFPQSVPTGATDKESNALESIVVTARYRKEDAESVPISLSVVGSSALTATYTNTVSDLATLVPSLNYTSANPRNTAFTIRGLGSSVVAVAQAN